MDYKFDVLDISTFCNDYEHYNEIVFVLNAGLYPQCIFIQSCDLLLNKEND